MTPKAAYSRPPSVRPSGSEGDPGRSRYYSNHTFGGSQFGWLDEGLRRVEGACEQEVNMFVCALGRGGESSESV